MDRRTALLDSAERLARSRGFDAFSFADLAKEAGITKASIHHHFPTKASMALDLITRYRETFTAKLAQVAATTSTAGAQLRAYVSIYRDALCNGDCLCLCVAFSAGRDSLDADVLNELAGFHADSRQWLIAMFERARLDGTIATPGAAANEASACLALVEGAQILARSSRHLPDFDQAVVGLLARATQIENRRSENEGEDPCV